jgi:hypothetical protein
VPQLLGWSLLSGIVGLIIEQIESRGLIGAIVGNVLDVAWRLTTWLTIPVIVAEGPGAFGALKRSSSLFKRTWGENMIAQVAFGLIGFALLVPGLLVGGLLVTIVPLVGIAVLIVWLAVTSTVMAALNGIFRSALYVHATGAPVAWFDQAALEGAFRPRARLLR